MAEAQPIYGDEPTEVRRFRYARMMYGLVAAQLLAPSLIGPLFIWATLCNTVYLIKDCNRVLSTPLFGFPCSGLANQRLAKPEFNEYEKYLRMFLCGCFRGTEGFLVGVIWSLDTKSSVLSAGFYATAALVGVVTSVLVGAHANAVMERYTLSELKLDLTVRLYRASRILCKCLAVYLLVAWTVGQTWDSEYYFCCLGALLFSIGLVPEFYIDTIPSRTVRSLLRSRLDKYHHNRRMVVVVAKDLQQRTPKLWNFP